MPPDLPDTTPGTSAQTRLEQASAELLDACDGFLRRSAIEASLTPDERREILRGMLLTRATDNRLKAFFTSGEIRYGHTPFQGKGFRSLGQEAIYAAAIRLRRGASYRGSGRLDRRRRRAGDSRSRRRARHATGAGGGAHGAERPDGKGRRAVRRQGSAHRRFRVGHPAAGRAAHHRRADRRRHRHGLLARTAPGASRCRSSAKADPRWANGTKRSTCAPRGACRPSSVSRTIRRRCRRRRPSRPPPVSSPTRRSATGFRASRPTAPIPMRSPPHSPGPWNGRVAVWVRRSSRRCRCACAATPITTTCCISAAIRGRRGSTRGSPSTATRTASGTNSGPPAIRWSTYAARLERAGIISAGDLEQFKRDAEAIVEREARAVVEAPWPDPAWAGRDVFANETSRVHVEVLDPAVRLKA